MSDEHNADNQDCQTERMEVEIKKEIAKLEYYLEGTDKLMETNDFEEIQVAVKQATKITSKLSDLISQLEELKIGNGETPQTVRQWKKNVKSKYLKWLGCKDKLSEALAIKDQRSQEESKR